MYVCVHIFGLMAGGFFLLVCPSMRAPNADAEDDDDSNDDNDDNATHILCECFFALNT